MELEPRHFHRRSGLKLISIAINTKMMADGIESGYMEAIDK